jgi:hypothetical protein
LNLEDAGSIFLCNAGNLLQYITYEAFTVKKVIKSSGAASHVKKECSSSSSDMTNPKRDEY